MPIIEVSTFSKAQSTRLDTSQQQLDQETTAAVRYVEKAFHASWNGDAAWQPILFAAMAANRDRIGRISASDLYDHILLPFYDQNGIKRPPNSRRGNFIGGRLGNMFNNNGPFVFGGVDENGNRFPQHVWTLKPAWKGEYIWQAIDHYWSHRKIKGFEKSSRAKRAEQEAGDFVAGHHAAFCRTDVDFRAQDAGVDGRASFHGQWVPKQVKEFAVEAHDVMTYMEHEPLYRKGGCLVAPKFKNNAVEYIRSKQGQFDIEFLEMVKQDLLHNQARTKHILMWMPK